MVSSLSIGKYHNSRVKLVIRMVRPCANYIICIILNLPNCKMIIITESTSSICSEDEVRKSAHNSEQ